MRWPISYSDLTTMGIHWQDGHPYLEAGVLDPTYRGLLLPVKAWDWPREEAA